MSDLIQAVNKGVVEQGKKSTTQKTSGNELGKDAFLKLLVTQMKYQDPLNPNTDTEYIAQLATFSQLEQMQNLGQVTTNSQALSLVGKSVIVKTETSSGSTVTESGRIDFVTMSGGKAQFSINGKLFNADSLVTVIDDIYKIEQGLPGVDEVVKLAFDATMPKEQSFKVNLGEDDTVAENVAILVNNVVIDSKHVKLSGNNVTISKEVIALLPNGDYKITVAFDDPLYTTVKDKVTLTVNNSSVIESPLENDEKGDDPVSPDADKDADKKE